MRLIILSVLFGVVLCGCGVTDNHEYCFNPQWLVGMEEAPAVSYAGENGYYTNVIQRGHIIYPMPDSEPTDNSRINLSLRPSADAWFVEWVYVR